MRIINPHNNVARLVQPEEANKVFQQAELIFDLLNKPIGLFGSFYAIAQPQCIDAAPLRFFVVNPSKDIFKTWKSVVIINPVIVKHTEATIESEEGCASFALLPAKKVQRWNKCVVEYTPLEFIEENDQTTAVFGKRVTRECFGKVAKVMQHEVDHLDCKYIYNI